jgi:predicted secreted protein
MPRKSASETASTTTSKPHKARATKPAPTHDQIALRAYHIYLQRHGAPGNPFDDWKQAEQELLAEAAAKPKLRARKSKVVPFAA